MSVNGNPRYVWNVLDADTSFLMATHVSRGRSMKETRAPIKKAKAVTPDRPMEALSDGTNSDHYAIGKELGYRAGDRVVNPHVRVPSIRAPESNNLVERLHGTEKERIKVMRGFETEKGTAALFEGFRTHYNLVRDHQSL